MSEPLIVVIPHRLGKDEALRRIKDGVARAKSEFAYLLRIDSDTWEGAAGEEIKSAILRAWSKMRPAFSGVR